jgi:hypothetical protein
VISGYIYAIRTSKNYKNMTGMHQKAQALVISLFLGSALAIFPQGIAAQNAQARIIVGPPPPVQPPLPILKVNSRLETWTNFRNTGQGYIEGPPWIKRGGMNTYYMSTSYTVEETGTNTLANDSYNDQDFSASNKVIVSSPLNWWGQYIPPGQVSNTTLQWRRNYSGIATAQSVVSDKGNIIAAYSHGENKNVVNSSGAYQNTIAPKYVLDPNNPSTYSYMDKNNIYHEDWDAYFAFINLNWIEDSYGTSWGQNYFWEEGPIAWPSNSYIDDNGNNNCSGLRHPSSFFNAANGYIYIYFMENWSARVNPADGRKSGIKVVRVSQTNAAHPEKYEVYFQGNWYPSLPPGFDKTTMMNFLNVPGPQSTTLLGDANSVRFSVAKINNTPYFLGVEELNDGTGEKINLHISADLVNWTGNEATVSWTPDFPSCPYSYPIFLDQTGSTNNEIDINNFYILGTGPNKPSGANFGGTLYKMRLNCELDPAITAGRQIGHSGSETTGQSLPDPIAISKQANLISIMEPVGSVPVSKSLSIYDAYGRLVRKESREASELSYNLDVSDITAPGIYVFILECGSEIRHLKFLVK